MLVMISCGLQNERLEKSVDVSHSSPLRFSWNLWYGTIVLWLMVAFQTPANALPFNSTDRDFENFVNKVWRERGASGVNIGTTMKSQDPDREFRSYWGFHNCIWKTNPKVIDGTGDIAESIGGNAYELFQCNGYLDYETPMKKERCRGRFSYEWRKKDGVWGKYIEQSLKRFLLVGRCID